MALEKIKIDMLREHLPYELNMLDYAYEALAKETLQSDDAELSKNASIECFFLHARNLIEFFNGSKSVERTASAAHFTTEEISYDLPKLMNEINNQIAHLNYPRGAHTKVLNGSDMRRIKEAIDRAVTLFQNKLSDDARPHWEVRMPNEIEIPASFYLSATNAIQVVKSVLAPEAYDI
jgi:hypothetical protein